MPIAPIEIQSRAGNYPVRCCSFSDAASFLPDDCIVITDENVNRHWQLAGKRTVVIPPGEGAKSLSQFGELISDCARLGAKRRTSLVALGGGVIGDLVGFVASAYMRGVPFIQIPTTLLAQVDSSVGGKVAIDMPEGKNIVGAFYPPTMVLVCRETMSTLPERQFRNGCAEVIKYGAILDRELADELYRHPLVSPEGPLEQIVDRCIRLKAQVVAEDELDLTGIRACLNFGHTVGHAIEQVTGYGPVLHGEGVAIGMVVESLLGERLGVTPEGTADWMAAYVRKHSLPVSSECMSDAAGLAAAMRSDKKNERTGLAFSLLTRIGECKLSTGVEETVVIDAIKEACKRYAGD